MTIGAATALVAASLLGQARGVPELALAAGGGALGGVLPDLDVRSPAHPLSDRLSRVVAAALLLAAVLLDARAGGTLAREAAARGLGGVAVGALGVATLLCAMRLSAHRSFSHSLLALAGIAASTWLAWPALAPAAAMGMASHLLLDLLNRRSLRLLWPLRTGFCLGLCKTDGLVDACCTAVGLVVAAYFVLLGI